MRPPVNTDLDIYARREAFRLSRTILDRILVPSVVDAAHLIDRVAADLCSEIAEATVMNPPTRSEMRNIVNIALSGFVSVKLDIDTIEVRGGVDRITAAFADIVAGTVRRTRSGPVLTHVFGISRYAYALRRQLPGANGYSQLVARRNPARSPVKVPLRAQPVRAF